MRSRFRSLLVALSLIASVIAIVHFYAWHEGQAFRAEQTRDREESARRKELLQRALIEREQYLKQAAAQYDAAGVRLTDIERFPEEQRATIRAVIARLTPSDAKPDEYMVHFRQGQEVREIHLRYEKHATDYEWRGDACGKCRSVEIDSKTDAVTIHGIR